MADTLGGRMGWGMDRIWQWAPAPALHLQRDGPAWQMHANDAASRWAAARGLSEADLRSLAEAARAAPGDRGVWAGAAAFSVVCR